MMSLRDEMVKCPFDEHHRVSRARFPVHLIKCRKQHKNKDFSICPYNATHYILTPEFKFHLENCPDRKEKDLAAAAAVVSEEEDRPTHVNDIVVPPPSEIWGNDGEEVISYLEVKDELISKLPILRAPTGMTKSERKRFMRREIHRFHNLARNQPSTSRKPDDDTEAARGGDEENEGDVENGRGEEEEEHDDGNDQDQGDNDKASDEEARGYQAEGYDDEEIGAVGGHDADGEFCVVKRKKKRNGVKWGVDDKGGRPSSDKKKNNHKRKHN